MLYQIIVHESVIYVSPYISRVYHCSLVVALKPVVIVAPTIPRINDALVVRNATIARGTNCSKEGKKYEMTIFNIAKMCRIIDERGGTNRAFNTQSSTELGGCNSRNDIECNFMGNGDVPIEIKKANTPDWMQCSIKYDTISGKWRGSDKNKIPDRSKQLFESLIDAIPIFNGKIPPFISKKVTHIEWLDIKKGTRDYDDMYLSCPDDTIKRLYSEKGCRYIQISGKGLFHLGEDVCGFDVPEFICSQKLRVRTKIHSRSDAHGFCSISVTVACQPIDIKKMVPSNYSLDTIETLPSNLMYIIST